jgi:hypothetical protein
MTPIPQLNLEPGEPSSLVGNQHLSNDEMVDLLACCSDGEQHSAEVVTNSRADAHLLNCPTCAGEFASLRETLSLFREATVYHAGREFNRIERPQVHIFPTSGAYSQGLLWLAASAILMAGILPIEMRWQQALHPSPTVSATASARSGQSDEALLEDINRELSASVPAPMQTLADPTGETADATVEVEASADGAQPSVPTPSQTSIQRNY